MEFNFEVPIEAITFSKEDNDLIIKGTAIDTSRNHNGWGILDSELDSLTKQFNERRQVRVDHSKHYRDIVGWVQEAERQNDSIKYNARIHDPVVQRILIKNPTAHHVSIGAFAKNINCSKCGNKSKPYKTCKCKDAYDIVSGLKLRELSLITDPAYETTDAIPIGFSASVTAALNDFSPKREYKCELSAAEERVCEYIKECNPGTLWNLAAAKELAPDYTNDFMKAVQRYEVAKATENKTKSEQKMATNIKASEEEVKKADTLTYDIAPAGKNIPYRDKPPAEQQFEQKLHEESKTAPEGKSPLEGANPSEKDPQETLMHVAPGGKNIPFSIRAPEEGAFEQHMKEELRRREDEVRKREDELRRREDELDKRETLGREYGTKSGHTSRGGLPSGGGAGSNKPSTYTNTRREDEDEDTKKDETLGKEYGQKTSHGARGGLPSGGGAGAENAPTYTTKSGKHEDTTHSKPTGDETGGGSSVMVLSEKLEEMSKKFEEAVKKFEEYHESDETKREEDEVSKVGRKMEEMSKKLEELVKSEEVFHKRKEDEAKKDEDEDEAKKKEEDEAKKEDEARKEASSTKKYTIGGKVAPQKEGTALAANIVRDAWSELMSNAKAKKPEWSLPQN